MRKGLKLNYTAKTCLSELDQIRLRYKKSLRGFRGELYETMQMTQGLIVRLDKNERLRRDFIKSVKAKSKKRGEGADKIESSSLYGTYSVVRYNGAVGDLGSAKGQYCATYTAGKAVSADYSCNPDFNVSQLGVITRWTPVNNLTFSAEVQWFHLDQKFTGSAVLAASAPKPTTVYEFKDQDTVLLQVRVQRNF